MQTAPKIEFFRGDGYAFQVTITVDSVVQDITGWTIWFTVKTNITDLDADAEIHKTITIHSDPENGISTISLDATDTEIEPGSYYYDVQFQSPTGEPFTIRGKCSVHADITRTSL